MEKRVDFKKLQKLYFHPELNPQLQNLFFCMANLPHNTRMKFIYRIAKEVEEALQIDEILIKRLCTYAENATGTFADLFYDELVKTRPAIAFKIMNETEYYFQGNSPEEDFKKLDNFLTSDYLTKEAKQWLLDTYTSDEEE